MWSGAISFGLVNVPVKMFTAAKSKDVHFNQLHGADRSRVQMKRFCSDEQVEIEYSELVRGYEVGPDEYVVVTDDELAALAPTVTSGIEIEEFVDLAEIDPVFFEHSYYLVPEKAGTKAYALLMGAMRDSGRIALGRVVLRQKQYLVAIRPAGRALAMSTLFFPDEVVSQDELDGLPGDDIKATDRELAMAQQLIAALSTEFEPEKYRDDYREALLAMIDEKAQGVIIEFTPKAAPSAKVTDLMAALEASIAAARQAKAS